MLTETELFNAQLAEMIRTHIPMTPEELAIIKRQDAYQDAHKEKLKDLGEAKVVLDKVRVMLENPDTDKYIIENQLTTYALIMKDVGLKKLVNKMWTYFDSTVSSDDKTTMKIEDLPFIADDCVYLQEVEDEYVAMNKAFEIELAEAKIVATENFNRDKEVNLQAAKAKKKAQLEKFNIPLHLLEKKQKTIKKVTDIKEYALEYGSIDDIMGEYEISEEDKSFMDAFNERGGMYNVHGNAEDVVENKAVEYIDMAGATETEVSNMRQSVDFINELMNITVPDDVIEYIFPDDYPYLNTMDKAREMTKEKIIAIRRAERGLPPQVDFGYHKTTELDRKLLGRTTAREQKALIEMSKEKGIGVNTFSYPIIHRYYKGELMFTVNFVDKYVNVTRLLQFAHKMGYTKTKNPRNITSWLETKMGRLLMNAGKDRFKEGMVHPRIGKVYKTDIRMGYKVTNRICYDECVDVDANRGVYLHPRIAAHVAMWVSSEFSVLFVEQFEEAVEDYYDLDWVEQYPEELYDTPMLPTKRQILMYQRTTASPQEVAQGIVNISVGNRAYINSITKKPFIKVLYYAQAIPDEKIVMRQIELVVNYIKTGKNKYVFGDTQHVENAIKILKEYDQYPAHLDGIWQVELLKINKLGSYQEEKVWYDVEKQKEVNLKRYGIGPAPAKNVGFWRDTITWVEYDENDEEVEWIFKGRLG